MIKPFSKPIATDGYSINLVKIEYGIEDYVVWFYTYEPYVIHKSKIYYGNRDYFKINGKRRYIDDFMRV